jgi:hypothetical protein
VLAVSVQVSPMERRALDLYHKEERSATLQVQSANLTNRLNVINFASLFSGTAVAPPRSISAVVKLTF